MHETTFVKKILQKVETMNFKHLRIVFCISLFFIGGTAQAMERKTKKLKLSRRQYDLGLQLINAIEQGNLARVKSLLHAGAPVNAFFDKDGDTELMLATMFGHAGIVKVLLEAGAEVNQISREMRQRSALGYAAMQNNPKVLSLLIDAGADMYYVNKVGQTILMIMAKGVWLYHMNDDANPVIVEKMLSIPSEDQKRRLYTFLSCLKQNYPENYSNFRHLSKGIFREMIKAENGPRVRMEIEKIEDEEVKRHLLKRYFDQ